MKLARFRIDLPVDDALLIDRVREHLREVLEGRGTENLSLPETKRNGEDAQAAMEELPPAVGRIHWPAVSVVMFTDREPPPTSERSRKRPAARATGSV